MTFFMTFTSRERIVRGVKERRDGKRGWGDVVRLRRYDVGQWYKVRGRQERGPVITAHLRDLPLQVRRELGIKHTECRFGLCLVRNESV